MINHGNTKMTPVLISTSDGMLKVSNAGVVTIDSSNPIGCIEYSEGFGRYVARTASGKIRQFNQGEKDTGETVIRRAARWVLKAGY